MEDKTAPTQDADKGSDENQAAVERGKVAIEMEKVTNPKPDNEKQKDQETDAENWRNEG